MITTRIQGDLKLKRQLRVLAMPPAKRKKFHREITKQVIRKARANIRAQRTVEGQPFKAPADRTRKKPMLNKLAKGKNLKAYVGPSTGKVTWPDNQKGRIARAQQEGHTEQVTAASVKKRRGSPDYDAEATKAQARALLKEGFKRPVGKYRSGAKKGQRKNRRVSQKWIMENMTLGQAGLILRLLRDEAESKKAWELTVPARPFFGLRKADATELSDRLIKTIFADMKHAA